MIPHNTDPMEQIVDDNPPRRSMDLFSDNLHRLRGLFPEVFIEGKIQFEVLKQLLGAAVDEREEKYGLNWHGKRQARQLALTPSTSTLRPCPDESVDWSTTNNLMIEGDNLEVLKLLQKSYASQVKLIYIDPPYNTGNDFIYPDNYRDTIKNYLELTGQIDGANRRLSSNTETSGRFHTTWLNMMYPRLKLARNLLTEDGIILISIGDEELHHLRTICSELFGNENYCGTFVWEKKKKPSFLDRNMGTVTDYIIAYAKDRTQTSPFTAGTVEQGKKYPFNNAGNAITDLTFPTGSVDFRMADQLVAAQDMSEGNIRTELLDDVEIQDGKNRDPFRLRGEWRYSQSRLNDFVDDRAEIVISKLPFRPNYINRSGQQKKTSNLLSHRVNGIPTNEDATQDARLVFGNDVVTYPKPEGLLKYLIRSASTGDDLVLDFFAGSGTTGSAVWRQNIDDFRSRRFILVQLPEPLDPSDKIQTAAARLCESIDKPPNLAELTKEWLRRAGITITRESPLLSSDTGFRVFRLDSSNFQLWNPTPSDLELSLLEHVENLKDGRSDHDILFEVLLRLGLDLCVPIEKRRVAEKEVYWVDHGRLFVCLASHLTGDDAQEMARSIASWRESLSDGQECVAVFRDGSFVDDAAKLNLAIALDQAGSVILKTL